MRHLNIYLTANNEFKITCVNQCYSYYNVQELPWHILCRSRNVVKPDLQVHLNVPSWKLSQSVLLTSQSLSRVLAHKSPAGKQTRLVYITVIVKSTGTRVTSWKHTRLVYITVIVQSTSTQVTSWKTHMIRIHHSHCLEYWHTSHQLENKHD